MIRPGLRVPRGPSARRPSASSTATTCIASDSSGLMALSDWLDYDPVIRAACLREAQGLEVQTCACRPNLSIVQMTRGPGGVRGTDGGSLSHDELRSGPARFALRPGASGPGVIVVGCVDHVTFFGPRPRSARRHREQRRRNSLVAASPIV